MGFGAVTDKASSGGIDYFTSPLTGLSVFQGCTAANDPGCTNTNSLSGFILGFGGDVIVWKHVGFGVDANIQAAKQTYESSLPSLPGYQVQSRVAFYDFNAIYEPIVQKKYALKLFGGIGDASFKSYVATEAGADVLAGNVNSSQLYSSSKHLDVDFGAGLQIYVSGGLFVRPEVRIHYANGFNQSGRGNFGSNIIPEYGAWVGYNWGGKH
jgi:hypothetical protein